MSKGELILRQVRRHMRQNTTYALPAGEIRKIPPEYVWVQFGHWQYRQVVRRQTLGGVSFAMVDIGYGVKPYSQTAIDLMQRDHERRAA